MTDARNEALPGFRRRFIVEPAPGRVRAAVEDDYHCMAVTLHHDGTRIVSVTSDMERAPWTTCPGAPAVLAATFADTPLAEAARRGEKQANCTHLHDLALLAAAHATDRDPMTYDIRVSDPVDGSCHAEIRRNGTGLLALSHREDVVVTPPDAAGASLFRLLPWIEGLPDALREAARLLQWATILAHGRGRPLEAQSDASRMPPNCYTFQDARKAEARRIGAIFDFSRGPREPLDHLTAEGFGLRA